MKLYTITLSTSYQEIESQLMLALVEKMTVEPANPLLLAEDLFVCQRRIYMHDTILNHMLSRILLFIQLYQILIILLSFFFLISSYY